MLDAGSGNGWLSKACLVVTVLLALSCRDKASGVTDQRSAPGGGGVENVETEIIRGSLFVNYLTQTSIRDCAAQRAEMPKVWESVVRARLNDPAVERVVLSPEEVSGQSLGMFFTRNASGQWSASVPCSVVIPTDPGGGAR
jgi:hypothetical protein